MSPLSHILCSRAGKARPTPELMKKMELRPRAGGRACERRALVLFRAARPTGVTDGTIRTSWSPNGAGQPRKRAARSGRRTASSGSPAATAVATRTASPPRAPHPDAPAALALAPVEAEPTAAAAVTEVAPAGPVVGIADFEEIFTRFQTPLTNFMYRLVGNREQAYDLAQDVFVKAYRALSSGTTIQAAALSSWLYRIASNTATDALRRRRLISLAAAVALQRGSRRGRRHAGGGLHHPPAAQPRRRGAPRWDGRLREWL